LRLRAATCARPSSPSIFVAGPAAASEDLAALSLVAVDDVDRADPAAQARLFTLYNRLQEKGGQLLAAASAPPGRLVLREDLRSRLGWGLAYEVAPLTDAEKPQALAGYALERGFRLGDDVIAYLLAHGRRDMPALVATLAALDRYSLAAKRPVTVPLLREWLQRSP
jgi:DnaA family protein